MQQLPSGVENLGTGGFLNFVCNEQHLWLIIITSVIITCVSTPGKGGTTKLQVKLSPSSVNCQSQQFSMEKKYKPGNLQIRQDLC